MQKTMTITLDEVVYDGLMNLIGHEKISQFFENLARPYVAKDNLTDAYRAMAKERQLTVNVSVCEGIWTAECDALGLVTEAQNYEELTHRALEIAPELAELNHVTNFKLRFVQ